jgi:hypothetical protein
MDGKTADRPSFIPTHVMTNPLQQPRYVQVLGGPLE